MKWSWKLGTFAGIGVYIHWTFLILIGYLLFAHLSQGSSVAETVAGIGLVLALFACVVLHEFGHALTARRFQIQTRDITLLPIGGVARLERMPEDPLQEFLVAIAGPAVNVVIAVILFGLIVVGGITMNLTEIDYWGGHFLVTLLAVNVILVLFNLLPAFPMDGGRVFRAILTKASGDYVWATQVAASVGQMMAIAFGLLGLFYNPFLIFIALFVFIGAQEEAHMVKMRSAFQGVPVRAAMQTVFTALAPSDSIGHAADELLAGSQQDFPVTEDAKVVGLLSRTDLVNALSERGREALIADVMKQDCPTVEDTDMLQRTFDRMRENGCRMLPVVRAGQLVGIVTLENIGELMMVTSALRQGRSPRR